MEEIKLAWAYGVITERQRRSEDGSRGMGPIFAKVNRDVCFLESSVKISECFRPGAIG